MDLNILNWTEAYLKYKDTAQRKIKTITKNEKEKTITCELKDETKQTYKCVENLKEIQIQKIQNTKISCLNTKENFNWLIQNWDELKKTNTTIHFANPKRANHWSITPKIHDTITEKNTIKTGLKTIFESIPEV